MSKTPDDVKSNMFKLADWAKSSGISYITAYGLYKKNKLPYPTVIDREGEIYLNNLDMFENKDTFFKFITKNFSKKVKEDEYVKEHIDLLFDYVSDFHHPLGTLGKMEPAKTEAVGAVKTTTTNEEKIESSAFSELYKIFEDPKIDLALANRKSNEKQNKFFTDLQLSQMGKKITESQKRLNNNELAFKRVDYSTVSIQQLISICLELIRKNNDSYLDVSLANQIKQTFQTIESHKDFKNCKQSQKVEIETINNWITSFDEKIEKYVMEVYNDVENGTDKATKELLISALKNKILTKVISDYKNNTTSPINKYTEPPNVSPGVGKITGDAAPMVSKDTLNPLDMTIVAAAATDKPKPTTTTTPAISDMLNKAIKDFNTPNRRW